MIYYIGSRELRKRERVEKEREREREREAGICACVALQSNLRGSRLGKN